MRTAGTPTTVAMFSHGSTLSGGAEQSFLETAKILKARGFQVVAFLPGPGELANALENASIEWVSRGYRPWMGLNRRILPRLFRLSVNAFVLARLVPETRQRHIAIVYTNTITINVGAALAWCLGVPHVWHLREFGQADHGLMFDWGTKLSYWLMRASGASFLANSAAVADTHGPPLKRRIRVVDQYLPQPPAGHDASVIDDGEDKPLSIVIVGTVTPGKRQTEAIEAVACLKARGVPVRLHVIGGAGDPAYYSAVQSRIDALGISTEVIFHGFSKNARELMSQLADVVLLCSAREAFGRVTVEAMMAGKAVVATRSGGTPEIIRDGVDGLLYEPGNFTELAEKLAGLYADPDRRRALGAEAKRSATARFGSRDRYGETVELALRGAMASERAQAV